MHQLCSLPSAHYILNHDKTSKHEFKFTDFPEQTMLCKMLKGIDVKGNIPKDPLC